MRLFPATDQPRALAGLVLAVFATGTGLGSIVPILPLYLRDRGVSYGAAGVVVAVGLAGSLLGQFPAGIASDRFGRRRVILAGLLLEAAGISALLLPLPLQALVLARLVSGLGAGVVGPTATALVADLVAEGERGAAYGLVSSARMAGFICGPLIGGVLAALGRQAVFAATAASVAVAFVTVAVAVRDRRPRRQARPHQAPAGGIVLVRLPAVQGVVAMTAALALISGAYSTVWPYYMKTLHATDWQIGLSFSLFALPLVLLAPIGGRAGDRFSRRWMATAGLGLTMACALLYPLLPGVGWVFAVGGLEGAAVAFAEPHLSAMLMGSVQAGRRGAAAGVSGTAEAAGLAIGAASGGWAFALAPWVPFVGAAAIGFALVAAGAWRLGRAALALEAGAGPEAQLRSAQREAVPLGAHGIHVQHGETE